MLPPKSSRILVAMSGGVDSAVTAALLAEEGYDCIGVTMRLVPEHEGKSVFEPCCGLEAAEDARRICEKVGIPHRIMHAVERFDRDIVTNFMGEYLQGRTPNPCVRCNRMIKFGALYSEANSLEADYIAMGHYARLEKRGERLSLRRAAYRPKDQSYVLSPLTQNQLARACFPLGALTKKEVRERAWRLDFGMATKGESQEICFVPDRDYGGYIEGRTGPSKPGAIRDTSGNVLGEHDGLLHYTIGQRRGLGIAAAQPLYVLSLDPIENAVIVGTAEETLCGTFTTGPLNWGGMAPTSGPVACLVQVRSRSDAAPCVTTPAVRATKRGASGRGAKVTLEEPVSAVTPGQWAVFYDQDGFVLAAAIIETVQKAASPDKRPATQTNTPSPAE